MAVQTKTSVRIQDVEGDGVTIEPYEPYEPNDGDNKFADAKWTIGGGYVTDDDLRAFAHAILELVPE